MRQESGSTTASYCGEATAPPGLSSARVSGCDWAAGEPSRETLLDSSCAASHSSYTDDAAGDDPPDRSSCDHGCSSTVTRTHVKLPKAGSHSVLAWINDHGHATTRGFFARRHLQSAQFSVCMSSKRHGAWRERAGEHLVEGSDFSLQGSSCSFRRHCRLLRRRNNTRWRLPGSGLLLLGNTIGPGTRHAARCICFSTCPCRQRSRAAPAGRASPPSKGPRCCVRRSVVRCRLPLLHSIGGAGDAPPAAGGLD